ncbi:hypothetical protein PTSG_13237 [Salpingoeca rosetta]|uniref:Uncharacterized protein n=1 Tax=Salpingoeca rosetta (strain ATCC 50818 / BSB-021) TaxID=946362 RepID=F2U0R6_SALR5|nr:uncharacterized protein PTSG_13237 [Salpingoeca rosetta]EGD80994.1 hypothetical protein PTSG_13237 [Salpingoeca rosetta]|eukprot:XP_004997555.1 hypothetical protein PTSG_13237 [Salpingoeca rosetta]
MGFTPRHPSTHAQALTTSPTCIESTPLQSVYSLQTPPASPRSLLLLDSLSNITCASSLASSSDMVSTSAHNITRPSLHHSTAPQPTHCVHLCFPSSLSFTTLSPQALFVYFTCVPPPLLSCFNSCHCCCCFHVLAYLPLSLFTTLCRHSFPFTSLPCLVHVSCCMCCNTS